MVAPCDGRGNCRRPGDHAKVTGLVGHVSVGGKEGAQRVPLEVRDVADGTDTVLVEVECVELEVVLEARHGSEAVLLGIEASQQGQLLQILYF